MKVYKYRGGGLNFERDLNSISENFFYAPNAEKLNDPCETMVFSDKAKKETSLLSNIIGAKATNNLTNLQDTLENFISTKKDVGIYSLSKTYNDELLWAHYANNHYGFCIEYDYDALMSRNSFYNFYSFDVEYSPMPPQISIMDISSNDNHFLIKKIAGIKSKRWSYEEEIRIITDKYGEHEYLHSAVKAIYFGLRMPEHERDEIMRRLAGRELEYYQIKLIEKSYTFEREQIQDKFKNFQKYLGEFQRDNGERVVYSISELQYQNPFRKGILRIVLNSKIGKQELERLGNDLSKKLFRNAEKVFMFYYLKDQLTQGYAWGSTHREKSNIMAQINGLTLEDEQLFIEKIANDKRQVIGQWMDESNLKLITIYQDGVKVFMEVLFKDSSSSDQELIVSKINEDTKYQDIDDKDGYYMTIDRKGLLSFHSENGVFNQLKKFN